MFKIDKKKSCRATRLEPYSSTERDMSHMAEERTSTFENKVHNLLSSRLSKVFPLSGRWIYNTMTIVRIYYAISATATSVRRRY